MNRHQTPIQWGFSRKSLDISLTTQSCGHGTSGIAIQRCRGTSEFLQILLFHMMQSPVWRGRGFLPIHSGEL
jgi:hypothetical protein